MTDNRMQLQKNEFDAADRFVQALKALPPIVDDDYSMMRSRYEGATYALLRAMKANGRFEEIASISEMESGFSLEYIGEVNKQRCTHWHPGGVDDWTPERWITAIVGELGEMANITKKLFRQADGMVGSSEARQQLEEKEADEWADTMIYMILFALRRRIRMTESIVRVFNRKSEELGFEERL